MKIGKLHILWNPKTVSFSTAKRSTEDPLDLSQYTEIGILNADHAADKLKRTSAGSTVRY